MKQLRLVGDTQCLKVIRCIGVEGKLRAHSNASAQAVERGLQCASFYCCAAVDMCGSFSWFRMERVYESVVCVSCITVANQ